MQKHTAGEARARTPRVADRDERCKIERKLDDEVRKLLHVCTESSGKIYRWPLC